MPTKFTIVMSHVVQRVTSQCEITPLWDADSGFVTRMYACVVYFWIMVSGHKGTQTHVVKSINSYKTEYKVKRLWCVNI